MRAVRAGIGLLERGLGRTVAAQLGGYRQRTGEDEREASLAPREPLRVAVVGGGLAGVAAADALARRGARVTILERNATLGGKIGGERVLAAGATRDVDHGFHAFFRHYYNLNAFLERVGAAAAMRPISDYSVVGRDGTTWSFGDVATTPGVNLIDLARAGVYRLRDVMRPVTRRELRAMLEYDPVSTFAQHDGKSFQQWADAAEIPERLRRVFTLFARAFFAHPDRISAAEVMKAFHFYYLSHDRGLLFDHPPTAARELVEAVERHLLGLGVTVRTGRTIQKVEPRATSVAVDGEEFDAVVIAVHATAARALAGRSPALRAACPGAAARLAALEDGARYAVLRLWVDRDLRRDLPVFVTVEREEVLDAIALVHRITEVDAAWARSAGGAVLELHSYAVPDALATDGEVEAALIGEMVRRFPELSGMAIVDRHLRVRDDFTALHVGAAARRPRTETEHPRVTLAGDWVALPVPAMLMEGAFTSGLFAANALLREAGLRPVAIETVPRRGLLARPEAGPGQQRRSQWAFL